jgi:hypothetical protein
VSRRAERARVSSCSTRHALEMGGSLSPSLSLSHDKTRPWPRFAAHDERRPQAMRGREREGEGGRGREGGKEREREREREKTRREAPSGDGAALKAPTCPVLSSTLFFSQLCSALFSTGRVALKHLGLNRTSRSQALGRARCLSAVGCQDESPSSTWARKVSQRRRLPGRVALKHLGAQGVSAP